MDARDVDPGTIAHIFIAPRKRAIPIGVASVEAVAGRGLRGDRYFDSRNRTGPDCQASLIEIENIEAVERATGLDIPPDLPRRNIVTRGIRLNDLVGRRFAIGAAVLEGIELCEPCGVIARVIDPRAMRPFVGKGGLRARVVSGGLIGVGDAVGTLATPRRVPGNV